MMWGSWLFWIFVAGLILFMFSRDGCCGHGGHGGHGGSRGDGGDVGRGGTGSEKKPDGETSRNSAHDGCR